MKKYFMFILLAIYYTSTFSYSRVNKIRLNTSPPQLVFDITTNKKPKYTSNYDEFNRLLFIEFENISLKQQVVKTAKFKGKYIENINIINYGANTGVFIKLKKNVGHRVFTLKKPYRVVVDLRPASSKKQFTIVIDAGHGGKDPGATGINGYHEKNIALQIAKKLAKQLEKEFNVILTRNKDVFVTLSNRSKIANRAKADLFVSLHLNASRSPSAKGFEIFYFSKKSSPYAGRVAAYENSFGEKYGEKTGSIAQIMGELSYNKNMEKSIFIAKNITRSLPPRLNMLNRGIYGANFAVLRGFNGPGMLIELGFITNKADVRKLTRDINQQIIVEEISDNIRDFFY